MGRNFPSYRSYLRKLVSELERVKRAIKDKEIVHGIDKIMDLILSESGAINLSSDPKIMQILILIAKLFSLVGDEKRKA